MPLTAPSAIPQHLSLISQMAGSIKRTLPDSVAVEDLRQEGCLSLVELESNGTSLLDQKASYIRTRIRGAMLDSLRAIDPATRDTRNRNRVLQQASQDLRNSLGREPSSAEVADVTGFSIAEVQSVINDSHNYQVVALSGLQSEEISQLPGWLATPADPEKIAYLKELRGLLSSATEVLLENEWLVLKLHYQNEMDFVSIAKQLGLTQGRISQLHIAALKKLKTQLTELGVTPARSRLA